MEPEIIKMLSAKEPPANIGHLLADLKKWLRFSRSRMNAQYPKWDRNLRIFRGLRYPDEEDMEARANDEPSKMTVPMSYTQVMTFVTFCYLLYKQNPSFFVLDVNENSDYDLIETSETILNRDLRHNGWNTKVIQSLLDVSRFGLCACKTVWKEEWQYIKVPTPITPMVNVGPFSVAPNAQGAPTTEKVLKYEGNQVITISPYRLLCDMRLPLTRWREGRFVADEYEYHIQYLKQLQHEGSVVGTEFLTRMDKATFTDANRDYGRFEFTEEAFGPGVQQTVQGQDDFMVISTEGQFKLIPSKYGLGDEDYEVDFIICVANDQRIVKIERCEYLHGDYIYDMAQFLPDVHMKLNHALSDSINALQDVITWLINARIVSVRRGLQTHAVVDPAVVNVANAEGRQTIYYLRKGAPRGMGIDKFFMQLKYQDPTTDHFNQADMLTKIMMTVTGVNENALGQTAPGRRSATENRAANAGAASRMMLHASVLWEDYFTPCGRKMLSNLRQGMSFESFEKIVGPTGPNSSMDIESMFAKFAPEDPRLLVGNEQFFVFDGTTASERGYIAQSLQEMFEVIASNPEINQLLDVDLNKLYEQIQFYRGIRNIARFKRPRQPTPGQSVVSGAIGGGAAPPGGGNPGVPPDTSVPISDGGIPGGPGSGGGKVM